MSKAVLQQKAWNDAFPETDTTTGEKGWSNNKVSLDWIEAYFDRELGLVQKGDYRRLCVRETPTGAIYTRLHRSCTLQEADPSAVPHGQLVSIVCCASCNNSRQF